MFSYILLALRIDSGKNGLEEFKAMQYPSQKTTNQSGFENIQQIFLFLCNVKISITKKTQ